MTGPLGLSTTFALSSEWTQSSTSMPYYECPTCGGGYVIEPAIPHPKCDRDGASLKRASEESYIQHEREDEFETPSTKPHPKKAKR